MDNLYALIMAGGGGTRLWPRSRQGQPKQFLNIGTAHSLLREAFLRIKPIIPAERVLVITGQKWLEAVTADRAARVHAFRESLEPLRVVLGTQPWLGGDAPLYADYIIMGHLMWARCISPFKLLEDDDLVHAWRARMLALFDGLAARAPGYPV